MFLGRGVSRGGGGREGTVKGKMVGNTLRLYGYLVVGRRGGRRGSFGGKGGGERWSEKEQSFGRIGRRGKCRGYGG